MIQKFKIIKELESILDNNLDESLFPYKKGNSIRIGFVAIRKTKYDYAVFDCRENAMIAKTFCMSSAVAIARSLVKGSNVTNKILDLDKDVEKNYIDCIFYKHIIKNSKDEIKKEITQTRYEIAKHKTQSIKTKLDQYIFF